MHMTLPHFAQSLIYAPSLRSVTNICSLTSLSHTPYRGTNRLALPTPCNLVWQSLWYRNKVSVHMTMVWTMLWASGVCKYALSRYVALLLASKSHSSRHAQIVLSSLFAKVNNGFRFSLEAHSLLVQTTAFTHLLQTYPRAFGPADGVQIPIPSSLIVQCVC